MTSWLNFFLASREPSNSTHIGSADLTQASYTTVVKRWPVILTNIVSSISNDLHELHSSTEPSAKDKIAEGKEIVSKISALKHEMGRNGSLTWVVVLENFLDH
jgi:hypothetical protein